MKKDKSTKRKPGIDAFDIGAIVAVVVPVVVLLLSLFLVFVLEWPDASSTNVVIDSQILVGAYIALKYSFIVVCIEIILISIAVSAM